MYGGPVVQFLSANFRLLFLLFDLRPSIFVCPSSFDFRFSSLARSRRGKSGVQHNSAIRCHAPAVEQF